MSRLFLVLFVLLFRLDAEHVSVDNAPKIITDNGNMIIQTAISKTIRFETLGGGKIKLNDIDLSTISNDINSFRSTINRINDLNKCNCELINTNIAANLESINNLKQSLRTTSDRLDGLTTTVTDLKQKIVADDCANNPCHNGGTCIDGFNSFKCVCPETYTGPNCMDDVNECTQFTGTDLGCQNNARCENYVGGYRCVCAGKWSGVLCNIPLNGCAGSSSTELCGHGTCIPDHSTNNLKPFKCICDHGWSLDSVTKTCIIDVDECSVGKFPCSENPFVTCINQPGHFSCGSCPTGFDGNGFQCRDVDECAEANICNMNEECINSFGSYKCQCVEGMTKNINGLCERENICEVDNGGCNINARCTMSSFRVEGRVCACNSGFTGNGIGLNGCVPEAAVNTTNRMYRRCVRFQLCRNGGSCQATTSGGFQCQCAQGFTGDLCGTAVINPCARSPCLNEGRCEFLPPNNHRCYCKPFFTGMNCETEHTECGGTFISPTGEQEVSINLTRSSQSSYRFPCIWTFVVTGEQFLQVKPTRLQLLGSCSQEYIQLQERSSFDGQTNEIGRYCQDSNYILRNYNTSGTILIIKVTLRRGIPQNHGFTLKVIPREIAVQNLDCCRCLNNEVVMTHLSNGIFQSPHFPLQYPNDFNCVMKFERNFTQRYRIELKIKTLDLGDIISNCSDSDFLKITFVEKGELRITACNQDSFQNKILITSGFTIQFVSDSRTSSRNSKFQILWTMSTEEDPCGGAVSINPQGTLSSPAISSDDEAYCTWQLQHTNTSKLILFKGYFLNWENGDCSVNLRIINRDNTGSHHLLWETCQSQNMLTDFQDQMEGDVVVIFRKSKGVSTPAFRITSEYACGQSVDMDQISHYDFQSSNYPNNYDDNSLCIYKFKAKTRKISVTFLNFDINDQEPCNYDYVDVSGNNIPYLSKRFCNGNKDLLIPIDKSFSSDSLTFTFKTNESISGQGFSASVDVFECGGSFFVQNRLYVAYPEAYLNSSTYNLNHQYRENKNCTWNIYSAPGTYMFVIFDHFHLEYHQNCRYDYLSFKYDDRPERKFCGNNAENIITRYNRLTIRFVSDFSVAGEGFILRIFGGPADRHCHQEIEGNEGLIVGPETGTLTRPYLCYYSIKVPVGFKVKINITIDGLERMNIAPNTIGTCWAQAKLKLKNGFLGATTIADVCPQNPQRGLITTSTNRASIVYFVPFYQSAREFNFTISFSSIDEECGSIHSDSSGEIASPNYPMFAPQNSYCKWQLQTTPGKRYRILITHLRAGSVDESEVCNDRNPVIKLKSETQEIDILCSDHMKTVYVFEDPAVQVIFNNRADTRYRFRLFYKQDCIFQSDKLNGRIESSNIIPVPYYCAWKLMSLRGSSISIQIDKFDLPRSRNGICRSYVEISDKNGVLLRKSCGNTLLNRTFISSNLPIQIKHYVDRHTPYEVRQTHEGLVLEYQVQGCVKNINYDPHETYGYHDNVQSAGTISSSQYPDSVSNIDCVWNFVTIPGYSIKLTFDVVELDSFTNCTEGPVLKAWENQITRGDAVFEVCHRIENGSPITFQSSTSKLILKFLSANDSNGGQRRIHGTYEIINSSCEYDIFASQGVIQSPNFPSQYMNNARCKWNLKVRDSMSIHLKFLEFETEGGNCHHDFVELLSPINDEMISIHKLCGLIANVSSTTYGSLSNRMVIVFKSDSSITKKGFKAKFFEGCGGFRHPNEVNQFLLSPNYPHEYTLPDGQCEWTFVANTTQPGLKIFFYFMGFEGHSINPSINCSLTTNSPPDNSLTIFDGFNEEAPIKMVLCSFVPYHPIISSGHYLKVILRSTSGKAIFKASYGTGSTACGGDFYLDDGLFTSPFYPNSVNLEIDCVYIIRNSPGSQIDLSIEEFTRQNNYAYLFHDFLEIRDGPNNTSPLVGRFYTLVQLRNFTLGFKFNNSVWLRLRSQGGDYTNSIRFLSKYHINYIFDHQSDQGSFSSPQFGHVYNQDLTRTWTIQADSSNRLEISFEQFSVGRRLADGDCSRGKLTITDSNNNVKVLCGSSIPVNAVYSTPIQVTLSAEGYRYPGFLLKWSIPKNESHTKIDSCEYIIQATKNLEILTSPNYPNFDPVNLYCAWTIRTDYDSALEIKMLNFSLENSTNCKYENFTVSLSGKVAPLYYYDQLFQNTTCGSPNISYFDFFDNYFFREAHFIFKVDRYDFFQGFKLTYRKRCYREISSSTEGWLQNDEYPNVITEKTNCTYILRLKGNRNFLLNVTALSLPPKTNGICTDGYLEISTRTFREKFCGSTIPTNLRPLYTNSSVVVIKLIGDFQRFSNTGFQLKYSLNEVEECGGNHILSHIGDEVIIRDPQDSTGFSPHYIECQWYITSPYQTRMKIDFETVVFLGDCSESYLSFYDGSTTAATKIGDKNYCHPKTSIFTTGNSMVMIFKNMNAFTRFKIRISISDCGGLIHRSRGTIQSPNYPSNYPRQSDCSWMVKVRLGSSITVNFLDLELESSCDKSNLTLSSKDFEENKILWSSCNNSAETVQVMNNKLQVTFKTNTQTTRKGFKLNFESNYINCGGTYSDPSADLETKNYPGNMPPGAVCTWIIKTDVSKRIFITVKEARLRNGCVRIVAYNHNYQNIICNRNLDNYEIDTNTTKVRLDLFSFRSSRMKFSYHTNFPSLCGYHIYSSENETGSIVVKNQNIPSCQYVIHNFPETEGTIAFKTVLLNNLICPHDVLVIKSVIDIEPGHFIKDASSLCNPVMARNDFVTLGRETDILFIPRKNLNFSNYGFQINYKYNRCGGLLTAPFGYIKSPNYPNRYPNYANCEWILKAPDNMHIRLIIRNLHLENHQTCGYDYLYIRYGPEFNSPPFKSYCGQHSIENETIDFRNNRLRLSFHSDISVSKDGFLVEYTFIDAAANCNGVIFNVRGSIKSPNYPNPYPSNLRCNWTVVIPRGYQIKVNFKLPFDLERSYDGVCRYDSLKMYDSNPNNLIADLCGHIPPANPIISLSNRIGFVFETDFNHNLDGFHAEYSPICGGTYNETFGEIFSATTFIGFGLREETQCNYLILPWANHLTTLRLLPNLPSCSFLNGHVQIFLEDRFGNYYFNRRVCGKSAKKIKIFHTRSIIIRYNITSYTAAKFSFSAIYLHDENTKVFVNLTTPYVVRTPQFPSPYHHNADLSWKFSSPAGFIFYIKIILIDIEPSYDGCRYDYVAFYKSHSTNSTDLVNLFCGLMRNISPFKIDSNILTVHFFSDSSHYANHTGFQGIVFPTPGPALGCGGIVNVTSGERSGLSSIDLNNDGLYDLNVYCEWHLIAPIGSAIRITFVNNSVNLEKRFKQFCLYDYLKILDGPYIVSPILQTICNNDQIDPITSFGNNMLIIFKSDSSINGRGFRLTFTTTPSTGQMYLTATNISQSFESPGYPNDTPYDFRLMSEMSTIEEPDHIIIEVTDLQVRESANCSLDRLIIQDMSLQHINRIRKLCKPIILPIIFISSHNRVLIQFQTGPAENTATGLSKRFQLSYKIYSCNRTEQAYSGSIVNIEKSKQRRYAHNLYCNLTLKAPTPTMRYQFYFKYFDLERSSTCIYDYIQFIFGGPNEPQYTLPKLCGSQLPASIVSNSSQVTILFVTDQSVHHNGYHITYVVNRDTQIKCGGDIELDSGAITSPGFGQNNYEEGLCIWNILFISNSPKFIKFTELQLGNGTSIGNVCLSNDHYVKLTISNRVFKYCGNTRPTVGFNTAVSAVTVEYKSTTGGTGIGFRIVWDTNEF